MGRGTGLAREEAAGQVFGQVWNWTEQCFRSKPGLWAGYLDPLLTVLLGTVSNILPNALKATISACLIGRSQVRSQDNLWYTPKDTFNYTENCTQWFTPSLHRSTLPCTLSRHKKHPISFEYDHLYILLILNSETYSIPGFAQHKVDCECLVVGPTKRVADGRWLVVGGGWLAVGWWWWLGVKSIW
jgi:hypothetical protein